MVGITKMKAEKQKAEKEAFFCTTKELSRLGLEQIPTQFQSHKHLIYSSPATLAFNSPGAEGFGVKRAGLAVPDSIMLIVAPGCCGRNTSLISSMKEYNDRFYYLMMDETDIVTGRHLKKIPKAYLFYSANHFMNIDYSVGYATASSPFGPWKKHPNSPIIHRSLVGENGSGHGDVFKGLDGKYYYVYHVHRSDSTVSPRKTRIVPLILKKGNDGIYNITVDKEHVIKPMWK